MLVPGYTQCCMLQLPLLFHVSVVAPCNMLLVYLLIPAGAECIIRLQRFAIVQPVDGIDR